MEDGGILARRRHYKVILAVSTQEVGIDPLPGKIVRFRAKRYTCLQNKRFDSSERI
jgi:hypothetical protein